MSDEINFPELARATRRLGLDAGELAEAMLSAYDATGDYWGSLHVVVREAVDRRGKYHGETNVRIDSGDIFAPSHRLQRLPRGDDSLGNMLRDGEIDAIDALAVAGAWAAPRPASAAELEFQCRRAAKLATVAVGDG